MVRGAGVRAELADESIDGTSLDLVLEVFADLEDGRRVLAHPEDDPPRLILGLRNVDREHRLAFVRSHLREAYLDPKSGDPKAWQALIAALGDEGLNFDVARLRTLPFVVEIGPLLIAALD